VDSEPGCTFHLCDQASWVKLLTRNLEMHSMNSDRDIGYPDILTLLGICKQMTGHNIQLGGNNFQFISNSLLSNSPKLQSNLLTGLLNKPKHV
jgi:hypothetical protein